MKIKCIFPLYCQVLFYTIKSIKKNFTLLSQIKNPQKCCQVEKEHCCFYGCALMCHKWEEKLQDYSTRRSEAVLEAYIFTFVKNQKSKFCKKFNQWFVQYWEREICSKKFKFNWKFWDSQDPRYAKETLWTLPWCMLCFF